MVGQQQIVYKLFTASENRVALAQPALLIAHFRESQEFGVNNCARDGAGS